MIGLLAIMVVSVFFHEIGHATALAYGGGNPGVMGAGIYIVWPAFYTDVTDAYRLSKGGRLRTDLGGVYFNGIFALLMGGAYFVTGFEPLLIVALVQHFGILQQMLPLLRLDGYYVLADLTGVPDLFARIRPTLRSLIPWRKTESAVKELKPWVRVVVTLWVMTVVPLLLYVFTMMVISAPRLIATAYDSFFIQLDRVRAAFGGGETTKGVASSFQLVALALPATGMAYSFGRVSKRVAAGAWKQSKERPFLRVFYGALGIAMVAGLAYLWLPNGEYKPIQPDERGTLTELTGAAREIGEGRPGLTEDREKELGGAPVLRDQQDPSNSGPWDSPTRNAPAVTNSEGQPEPATTPTPEETTEEEQEPTDEETVPEEEEEEPAPTPTPSG
jgi:putative peptide zinc metalloprotease protein